MCPRIQNAIVFDYGAVDVLKGEQQQKKNIDESEKAKKPDAKIVYVGASEKNYINDMKSVTTKLGKIYGKEDKAKSLIEEIKNSGYKSES